VVLRVQRNSMVNNLDPISATSQVEAHPSNEKIVSNLELIPASWSSARSNAGVWVNSLSLIFLYTSFSR
jgi:hypothetical protein